MIKNNERIRQILPAFTLAEVLIVLSLIGVVAVLTIPAFTNNTSQRVTITNAQKAEYDINQLALRLQTECPRLRCSDKNDKITNLLSKMNKSPKDVKLEWDETNEKMTVKLNGSTNADLEYTLESNGQVKATEEDKYKSGGCSAKKPCANDAKGYICYKFSEGCD